MPGQRGNVFGAFTQRRQVYGDDVQSVIKIFAKTAFSNFLLKVLMRCRQNAHISPQKVASANAMIITLGQYPQQPGLQRQRHITDFIKKKGSTGSFFETSGSPGVGTCK